MVSNLSQGVIKKSEGLYADNDNVVKLRSQAEKKRTTTPPTAKELMSWSKCSVVCIKCDERLSTG